MKTITAKFGVVLLCGTGAAIAASAIMTVSDKPARDAVPVAAPDAKVDRSRVERATTQVALSTPAASSKSATSGGVKGCIFEEGAVSSFKIEGKDAARIDPSGFGMQGDAGEIEIESSYSATLHTEVLEVGEDGALLLGQLDDFRSTAVREDARVAAPFLFRVSEGCGLQGFAHDASLQEGYARIQQALLHDMTFDVPVGDVALFFEGQDTLGEVAGRVKRIDGKLEKRVSSLRAWSLGMGSLSSVDSAITVITPAESGWFSNLAFTGHYTGTGITSTRKLTVARQENEGATSLSKISRAEKDYVWADLLSRMIPLDEGVAISQHELKQRDAVRDKSVDTILDRLVERVDDENVGIQDTWPELRAYMEARPEMAQVVADRIIANEIPAQATMGAFIALGNTRNAEARQALEAIVHDPSIAAFDRVRAMFSLVDRADVEDEFALQLAKLAAPLANSKSKEEHLTARHALLALGMMSGRKPNREDIKKIAVDAIRDALASAPNSIIASPAYGALMNVGDPALLAMIEDIPDHPDYSTREVAAIAMRRMPPSKTAEFTRRWLAKEKDWRVKITLYHSLELQTFAAQEMTSREVVELAVADLEKRPGAITRKALVRLLGRAAQEMDPTDPLRERIEGELAAMIPFEVENRTGLYLTIAPFVDPATLRQALMRQPTQDNSPTDPLPGSGVIDADTPSLSSAVSGPLRSAK